MPPSPMLFWKTMKLITPLELWRVLVGTAKTQKLSGKGGQESLKIDPREVS